jgi:hypothetical protein
MKTMTIMKKLMFTLAIVTLLYGPTARAEYIGTFTAGSFYTFEVSTLANVEWTVTFTSVVRGRLQVDNVITGNGNLPVTNIPVPAHADRVILLVDTRGGSAQIRLNGGVLQEFTANPEARIVADVVP